MNFQYLGHLPVLPAHIVDEVVAIAIGIQPAKYSNLQHKNTIQSNSNNMPDDSLGYPISEIYKYFENTVNVDFLEANDAIKEWVFSNIFPNPDFVSIQSMFGWHTLIPHVDVGRIQAYNYIIDDAGASLCFWKPVDKFKNLKIYPQTVFTYDMIDLDEEIRPMTHKWHKLDVTKIHSVKNISPDSRRISLSLSYIGIQ
jgi:hypothetical protein